MSLATKGLIDELFWAGTLIRSSTAIKAITLLYICKQQVLHDICQSLIKESLLLSYQPRVTVTSFFS